MELGKTVRSIIGSSETETEELPACARGERFEKDGDCFSVTTRSGKMHKLNHNTICHES